MSTRHEFDGSAGDYFGVAILSGLLAAVTLGIGTPWAMCMVKKWRVEHTILNGNRMRFTGTGGELFGKYIVWLLLLIVTAGIYTFWMVPQMEAWMAEHTEVDI